MAEILVIDDQDRTFDLCNRAIPEHRWRGPARSWSAAQNELSRAKGRVDLVLLDVHFDVPTDELLGWEPGADERKVEQLRRTQGLEILRAIRGRWPDLPVVLMTSKDEVAIDQWAEQLHAEEYTYFLDDEYVDARSLRGQIDGIVATRRGEESEGPVFWGRSLAMRRIRQRLAVLARGRLPVVLLGPTGTGKSLLARHVIHERSGRKGLFVAVDLATVPRELMAAHLFGSVKGAYTGSIADRTGAFEAAHGGTLFLDEVGNLSMDAQKMLLSVLQEGTVTRIGDLRERPVDVKVVVATNEDLAVRVAEGAFRADLYMRLNPAAAVTLPALRDRAVDFDRLLAFTLEQALARPYLRELVHDYRESNGIKGGPVETIASATVPPADGQTLFLLFPERSLRLLRAHTWPGNLREFAMTVENAVLFALSELASVRGGDRADVIQVRPKLVRDLLGAAVPAEPGAPAGEGWETRVRVAPSDTLNKVAQEVERQYFRTLYVQEHGEFGAMARILLGGEEHARKIQLRFNQLGLKVRELKEQLQT
jgi:DNA-binding NtrC family response regulator